MDIRNCRNCGNIFNYVRGPIICPACRESLEAKFQEVKTYIQEHPGVSMHVVSEECDVETSLIRQWLREERLEMAEDSAVYLDCESCGAPIRSGKYCEKCKANLLSGLKNAMHQPESKKPDRPKPDNKSQSAKMRFLS
ncbi:MAG: flagellar protein [Roseburia sp.]|nr:flagellar protein [Roseburia sp.]